MSIPERSAQPPEPYGPVPSARQLAWHEIEFHGFIHFTVNTFTDKEWGYGDESPGIFNPEEFDADRMVETAAAVGMRGLTLTCKHHDGFCLWPSRYTDHSVRNSPWRGGKGDVVRELSEACVRAGLKFGVYLSPWDRNRADYAEQSYLDYYRNQLRELLQDYGPIYEVWYDGANGGDGYYGGARETRTIDKRTYYDWEQTWAIVRELQPDACIFSDAGPDTRWVGNEKGFAGETCWATLSREDFIPGEADRERLHAGDRSGTHWVPAECDVSIRPGWFYHPAEDDQVRTPENLTDLYFQSVGRGACLLLNLPPDRRGLIHEADVRALQGFRARLASIFDRNLAAGSRASSDAVRGNNERYGPGCAIDGQAGTYWSTDDDVTRADLVLEFADPVTFNVVSLREHLPLGQRIDRVAVDVDEGGTWREVAQTTSIGSRRLLRVPESTTGRVRVRVLDAAACPAISELAIYHDPDAS